YIFFSDIEAQIREAQERKNVNQDEDQEAAEKAHLDRGGFFDTDIYDNGGNNKYDQYVQSIAVDDVDDEDDDGGTTLGKKSSGYNAPQFFLKEMVDKDHDPMAQYKRPTIADREDEYRARRRMQAISPERFDHFADGGRTPDMHARTYTHIMKETLLKGEEAQLRKTVQEKAKDGSLQVVSNGDSAKV
ncbi:UNVERIFIED_CONTAM: hypothetical protein GTU68_042963, partial [Idotea baltica]|nr:hypothetical protein [Idotea baltica]